MIADAERRYVSSSIFGLLGLTLPGVVVTAYVIPYAVDAPNSDEWWMLPLIDQWLSGEGSWADIFDRDRVHRIAIQRAVALASAYSTNWDVRVEIFVGLFFLLTTGVALFLYAHSRGLLAKPLTAFILMFALGCSLFGLRQWENLLSPAAINPFASSFFVILAFYLLLRPSAVRFAGACVSALLGCAAFSNAALVWPIGFFLVPPKRRLVWCALAIPAAIFCFPVLAGASKISYIDLFPRWLVAIGSQFSLSQGMIAGGGDGVSQSSLDIGLALALGLGLIAIIAWGIRNTELLREHRFALSLIAFGVASCALIAIGRGWQGIFQASSSRYTSTASLVLIGALLLWFEQPRRVAGQALLVVGAIVPALAGLWTEGIVMAESRRISLQAHAAKVANYKSLPDDQLPWSGGVEPRQMREWIGILERRRLSVFREPK
jgi:hypothetical protein